MTLGDRMKRYEAANKYLLPIRTNVIIRVDGKAFHTFTRGMTKPFCIGLQYCMDDTAKFLLDNIQNSKYAYVQSDEISILLTDYDNLDTQQWFGGSVQKMASVSASLATGFFNKQFQELVKISPEILFDLDKTVRVETAFFDSRVFQLPHFDEVINYFIWRQQDATRNSIQMVGQANFSHKELQGLSCDDIQEKLWKEKDINWNDFDSDFKRGRFITHEGKMDECPIFTKDRGVFELESQ